MPEADRRFRYVAVDADGRRVRGSVSALSEASAFARLQGEGLSPLRLTPARARPVVRARRSGLSDRDAVDLVGNLGHLLKAGADMRTALGILGARTSHEALTGVCRDLVADIGGGAALETSFARHLGRHGPFVGTLVAAGEASGDLSGGLARAAEILESRMKLRAKLGSILAYPAFVLASTVAAVVALLLLVIPSLAPLVQDAGAEPPLSLRLMIGASEVMRANLALIGLGLAGLLAALLLALRAGVLAQGLDHLLLKGPARRTAGGLAFGAFAIVLGGMLSAGTPMSETLRLAIRSISSGVARRRLEPVLGAVRQGRTLSAALETVDGFPKSIVRLASVGEATGALGPMLVRGGKLEEDAAMTRIETIGQLLGPILIVGLGGLVGVLMAGLLSGVSQLGDTALQ